MAHGRSDAEIVRSTHNTARFFTESRHIAWVLLAATLAWGVFGYLRMPQRKDPEVPVRIAAAMCPWPGASAEKIELLVTRPIEEKMRENSNVERVESVTRNGIAVLYVLMDEATKDRAKEFDDIQLKLNTIGNLPDGAGPIVFMKDFGDTVALMLTVASPPASGVEIALRARDARQAIA
ncbi:MAG TPA: efflux RND transporter permease subunit, partial [Candidatus Polarisedimenticolaceae bacterium]|nr:efflux RND transporter permease subunit [Candidatus Polarisedimenticolaceae bacterium]